MEGPRVAMRLSALVAAAAVASALAACGVKEGGGDLVAGKQQFVQKCGSCHTLNRAETKGQTGPNLDEAFSQALSDGFNRAGVRGMVHEQILYPARVPASSPAYMPPKLVTGRDAENVAAYVAAVVGRSGQDTGLLATAVKKAGSGEPAVARDGQLPIPADPGGQLAFVTARASAPAGRVTVESKNDSSIQHNIAVQGNGVDEVGPVVGQGGVSRVEVDLQPGTYDYVCTVPGHREGGMAGKLTVK